VTTIAWQPDVTDALQAALQPGAEVVLPYDPRPYVVARTIRMYTRSTLRLCPGVTLEAKRGQFLDPGGYDAPNPLLSIVGAQRVRVVGGPGSRLLMHREDYTEPPYAKSEYRHGVFIAGSEDVEFTGPTIADTGGDGLYVTSRPSAIGGRIASVNVRVADVTAESCYRNAFCIASVENLRMERCRAIGTQGVAPQAGFLIEPNNEDDWLAGVRLIDCAAHSNSGAGIMVQLIKLWHLSREISVSVENPLVTGSGAKQPAIRCLMGRDRNAPGVVTFDGLVCRDFTTPGLAVEWSMQNNTFLRFKDCTWDHCDSDNDASAWHLKLTNVGNPAGRKPVTFENCRLFGVSTTRPWCKVEGDGLFPDVLGYVTCMDGPDPALSVAALPNLAAHRA
jgi:hypothetical protein